MAYLTLLRSILGPDFPTALARQQAIGIEYLDLKDGLWGKTIEHLNTNEAAQAASLIDQFRCRVHCFSTSIGHTSLEPDTDEAAFRARHEPALANAVRVAHVLRPQVIRLLAPRLQAVPGEITPRHLLRQFPWTVGVYRDWVDQITSEGFGVLIENEAIGCALASVADIQTFLPLWNALPRATRGTCRICGKMGPFPVWKSIGSCCHGSVQSISKADAVERTAKLWSGLRRLTKLRGLS